MEKEREFFLCQLSELLSEEDKAYLICLFGEQLNNNTKENQNKITENKQNKTTILFNIEDQISEYNITATADFADTTTRRKTPQPLGLSGRESEDYLIDYFKTIAQNSKNFVNPNIFIHKEVREDLQTLSDVLSKQSIEEVILERTKIIKALDNLNKRISDNDILKVLRIYNTYFIKILNTILRKEMENLHG